MSADPNYASVLPRAEVGVISTANTNRDGSGTGPSTPIFSAGASGSKIEQIDVVARGTTTAGVVRLYLYDGSGSDAHLLEEILVTAITPGVATEVFNASRKFENLVIKTGWSITASTNNAETFGVFVYGADF